MADLDAELATRLSRLAAAVPVSTGQLDVVHRDSVRGRSGVRVAWVLPIVVAVIAIATFGLLGLVGESPPTAHPATNQPSHVTSAATAAPIHWEELIGDGFVAIAATRAGRPVALVPEAPLGLGFTDASHFGASFGCNGGGGTYEIRDGRLETKDVYMTLMACFGDRGELEGWYYPFLLSGPRIDRVAGGFVLTSGDVVVTYVEARLAPSPPGRELTWVAIRGPRDARPSEDLVLEMGGMAWDGFGGVASIPASDPIRVRLVGRASCRVYAEFIANPGSGTVIRFSEDGRVSVNDRTDRDIDPGPTLAHQRSSDCPVE
jgi:heat shock protein HslJ